MAVPEFSSVWVPVSVLSSVIVGVEECSRAEFLSVWVPVSVLPSVRVCVSVIVNVWSSVLSDVKDFMGDRANDNVSVRS